MTEDRISPDQCAMARSGLRLTVEDLVTLSGVPRETIKRFESGGDVGDAFVARLQDWFVSRGVSFPPGGARLPMKVWRLAPVDLDHRNWLASTRKGPLVIRAIGERRARQIASMACGIATKRVPGEPMAVNPWRIETMVAAEQVEGDADGPEAILEPPEYDHEWRR